MSNKIKVIIGIVVLVLSVSAYAGWVEHEKNRIITMEYYAVDKNGTEVQLGLIGATKDGRNVQMYNSYTEKYYDPASVEAARISLQMALNAYTQGHPDDFSVRSREINPGHGKEAMSNEGKYFTEGPDGHWYILQKGEEA